jgi:hypothetical protein
VQALAASRRMLDAMWEGLELPSGARRA